METKVSSRNQNNQSLVSEGLVTLQDAIANKSASRISKQVDLTNQSD